MMLNTIDSVRCFFITFVEYADDQLVETLGDHSFIEQGIVCGPIYLILFGAI